MDVGACVQLDVDPCAMPKDYLTLARRRSADEMFRDVCVQSLASV